MKSVVEKRHGPEMLSAFGTWKALGYHLASIAASGPSSYPRYVAVFVPLPKADQHLVLDIEQDDLELVVASEAASGYYATQITGTWGQGSFGKPTFAVVFELRYPVPPEPPVVFPVLSWVALSEVVKQTDGYNGNVTSLDVYKTIDGGELFCAIIDRYPQTRQHYRAHLWDKLQGSIVTRPEYKAMQRCWTMARAAVAIPIEPDLPEEFYTNELLDFWKPLVPDKIMTFWQAETLVPWPSFQLSDQDGEPIDDFTGGVLAHGPFDDTGLFGFELSLAESGRWIIYVGACGSGGHYGTRYTVLTAPVGAFWPLPRTFKVKTAVPLVFQQTNAPVWKQLLSMEAAGQLEHDDAEVDDGHPIVRTRTRIGGTPPQPEQSLTPVHVPALVSPAQFFVPWRSFMSRLMRRNGARMGQLVVARNGRGKLSLACTRAEDGYPDCEHHSKMRVGSVAKWLTAMAAIKLWGVPTPQRPQGLLTPVASALGLASTPGPNAFLLGSAMTIDALLRHRTGLGSDDGNLLPPGWGIDQIVSTVQRYPEPGDYGAFLEAYTGELLAPPNPPMFPDGGLPYAQGLYLNHNFGILGEVVSRGSVFEDRQNYEGAMLGFWNLGSIDYTRLPHVIRPGWKESRGLGEPPCHERNPDYSGPLRRPYRYDFDSRYQAGAGNWAISALDVARVSARMDPSSASPILTEAQFALFTEPFAPFGNEIESNGRGCYKYLFRFPFPSANPEGRAVRVFVHNGEQYGGCGLVIHMVPREDVFSTGGGIHGLQLEPDAATPSVTFAIAFNHNFGLGDGEIAELVAIAAAAEEAGYWPDGDLFEQV